MGETDGEKSFVYKSEKKRDKDNAALMMEVGLREWGVSAVSMQ